MGRDYIPEKDYAAGVWMKWFAFRLVEQPDSYRTTPQEAAEVDAAVTAFRTAQARAWPRGTRCKSLVREKNLTRKTAERLVRPIAQRLRTDPKIADSLKVMIGLKPKTKRRRQIPAPDTVPVLTARSAMSGYVTVSVSDSTSTRRGKPAGARGVDLWERVAPYDQSLRQGGTGPGAIGVDHAWRYIGQYTRALITLQPAMRNRLDEVSYVGRWVTARGKAGALGTAVSLHPHFNPARDVNAMMRPNARAA